MKENEGTSMNTFNPGEYCRFKSEEIQRILDILRANGHDVIDNEYPYGEDCVFCFPTGGMSHFARSLMTDGFVNYTELSLHDFMVKALRLEEGMGINGTPKQKKHIVETVESLGMNVSEHFDDAQYEHNIGLIRDCWHSTSTGLTLIDYTELCKRLCIEPIVETKTGLPENGWAILCTEESMAHPMWKTMIGSLNFTIGTHEFLFGDKRNVFYGMDDSGVGSCGIDVLFFGIGATLITIDDWCRMTGNVKSELEINTCEQEPVFDPSKPFEVSNDGKNWSECIFNQVTYVGVNRSNQHVVEVDKGKDIWVYEDYAHIRNIEPFNAGMLEVGEYMETEAGSDGKRNLLRRISHNEWIDLWNDPGQFYLAEEESGRIKGRRVNVEIKAKKV